MPHQPNSMTRTAIVASLLACFTAPAQADMSMEERFKAMESRMDSLERENRALKGQLQKTEQKVEVTGEQMEKIAVQGTSPKAAWAEKTQFGGYGELHLNKLKNEKKGGAK